jgi:transcription initiation factor TFIIH subunit 3
MSKALCYINRHTPEGRDKLDTRLLVINATPGSSSAAAGQTTSNGEAGNGAAKPKATATGGMRGGYVGLMNCVFAAQKAKVPIDVLSLPPPHTGTAPPIFLQQASYLTEGVWWRWNGRGGMLQYLHVSGRG